MGIGLPIEREHVVEFIKGTGVKIDGVTYSNYNGGGVNGPWTWVVPKDVSILIADIVSGGAGGGGGWNTGTSLAGGGGGGSGCGIFSAEISVTPNATLTITVGAGGAGGAVAANGTAGGNTSVTGLICNGFINDTDLTTITLGTPYNQAGQAATSTTSGSGGSGGNNLLASGSSRTNATSPPSGVPCSGLYPATDAQRSLVRVFGVVPILSGGGSGGAASTVGSTAGGEGGGRGAGGGIYNSVWGYQDGRDFGNTTGTISRGAGGAGGSCLTGKGGTGSTGGVVGGNASGYGGGGGGGGGGAAGGNGSDGYVRFVYTSSL